MFVFFHVSHSPDAESYLIISSSGVLLMCCSGWLTDEDLTDLDNSTQSLERRLNALVSQTSVCQGIPSTVLAPV